MWKNTANISKAFSYLGKYFVDQKFRTPYPKPEVYRQLDGRHELHDFLSDIYEESREGAKPGYGSEAAERVRRVILKKAFALARSIESSQNYDLACDLYDAADDIVFFASIGVCDERIKEYVLVFAGFIHWLVGDEKRFLVGTRGGPAWKPYIPSRDWKDIRSFIDTPYHIDSVMRYVGADDVDVLPDEDQWAKYEDIDALKWPPVKNCYGHIARVLEHAYYNQRYVIDPKGAYVKITGDPFVRSVTLKAKKGLKDPNHVDLLAKFELPSGFDFQVLEANKGTLALQDQDFDNRMSRYVYNEETNKTTRYCLIILAQVYHDLVTAVEMPFNQPVSVQNTGLKSSDEENEILAQAQLTVIPRVIRKVEQSPRQAMEHPRIITPHRVRGYKRSGNLSEEHKKRLQEFEAETGFQILKWLPEGYTFVRPHISPAQDSDRIKQYPQFIRYRIQEEIKQVLSKGDPGEI